MILILSYLRVFFSFFLNSQSAGGVDFDFYFGFFLLAVGLLPFIIILSVSASSSTLFSPTKQGAWSYLDFAAGSACSRAAVV